jgi:A/G-specific adenine glycosylase
VLARHGAIDGFPGEPNVERSLWAHAETRLPDTGIEAYTQALMDLGATVCLRRAPHCEDCPVAHDCIARREGRIDELPTPRPKKVLPQRAVSILLLERCDEVLLEKRPATGIWAGLWSLPELAPGADVVAHCQARFAAEVAPGPPLPAIEHGFTHFRLTLHPRPCAVRGWPHRAEEPGLLWMALADVPGAALPAPIKKLLRERARA